VDLRIFYRIYLALGKILRLAVLVCMAVILAGVGTLFALRKGPISITPLMVINQKSSKVAPMKRWVPLDSISPEAIRAVIASEDNNYFYHYGFDIEAIKEAMKRNERGKKVYGASTITQQTAKNVFLTPNRTWTRKGMELVISVLIDKIWGKDRVMEVYLNVIEMGPNIYGIEAAARHYFKKSAYKLTKNEATLIAISLPDPKKFNPARPSAYMLQRRDQLYEVVHKSMKIGWYKNVKNIKQIPVNYLDQYDIPSTKEVVEKEAQADTNAAVDDINEI
jgi:monofunctional biosynthetic peptidoglycan transglycosylase